MSVLSCRGSEMSNVSSGETKKLLLCCSTRPASASRSDGLGSIFLDLSLFHRGDEHARVACRSEFYRCRGSRRCERIPDQPALGASSPASRAVVTDVPACGRQEGN